MCRAQFHIGRHFSVQEDGQWRWEEIPFTRHIDKNLEAEILVVTRSRSVTTLSKNRLYRLVLTGNGTFTIYQRDQFGRVEKVESVKTDCMLQLLNNGIERIN
jgi:hypothetical protein